MHLVIIDYFKILSQCKLNLFHVYTINIILDKIYVNFSFIISFPTFDSKKKIIFFNKIVMKFID